MKILVKNEIAMNEVFSELDTYYQERHIGFHGYFKAVQGDIYYNVMNRINDYPFEDKLTLSRIEIIRIEIANYMHVNYPHIYNFIAHTEFQSGGELIDRNSSQNSPEFDTVLDWTATGVNPDEEQE